MLLDGVIWQEEINIFAILLDMMISIYVAVFATLEDKPYANMTIPGKVQSYMAAGKPIIGAINGSTANFIENNEIGYVCNSGNVKALADLIKYLRFTSLTSIGKHFKDAYWAKYNKERFIDKLITTLKRYIK